MVLMRDESGCVMLLLLLQPFQRRPKYTNTEVRQRDPPLLLLTAFRTRAAVETESTWKRPRSGFKPPAPDAGFPFCSGSVSVSPAGLTLRHTSALDHSGPAAAASALSSSSGTKQTRLFILFIYFDLYFAPRWICWSLEHRSGRTRRCHGAQLCPVLVLNGTERRNYSGLKRTPAPGKLCLKSGFKSALFFSVITSSLN